MCMLGGYEQALDRLDDDSQSLNFSINGVTINQVCSTPYLGIAVDSSLKWDDYIMNLCKNVSRKLGLLGRLRKSLRNDTLKHIYLTIIQPKLDYAISVWGYCSQINRTLVTRLQHRAARIVSGNFDYINVRGADLVKQLGWQTIEQRRDYFTATLMYKIIHKHAPKRLTDSIIMTSETHDIPTRLASSDLLQVPHPHYEIFRNSFRYQGSIIWNSLPSQLRNAADTDTFKRLYKDKYFYDRRAVPEVVPHT